jgi:YfiH family protein
MFKEFIKDGQCLGLTFEIERLFFFFGTRHLPEAELNQVFPNYEFCFAKQVHGCTVTPGDPKVAPKDRPEADVLWTSQPGRAVVVQTADCVPILLASHSKVCAVHAGWRGVANQIVNAVHRKVPDFNPLYAVLGPHIQAKSFEVGPDVAEQLSGAVPPPHDKKSVRSLGSSGKPHIDLNLLVRLQLHSTFDGLALESCNIDTLSDARFCSYRRDGSGGRQFSFVVINP